MNAESVVDGGAEARSSEERCAFDVAWKMKTLEGNAAFDEGRHKEAMRIYQCAIEEALTVFNESKKRSGVNAKDAAPMLVVSTFNAARNFQRLGNYLAMEHAFVSTADIFLATLGETDAPRDLQEACAVHFTKLLTEYKVVLGEAELCLTRYHEYFDRARAAVLNFYQSRSSMN